jgi:hypothetical protein
MKSLTESHYLLGLLFWQNFDFLSIIHKLINTIIKSFTFLGCLQLPASISN